jgi:hypothetical protein
LAENVKMDFAEKNSAQAELQSEIAVMMGMLVTGWRRALTVHVPQAPQYNAQELHPTVLQESASVQAGLQQETAVMMGMPVTGWSHVLAVHASREWQ